MNFFKKNENKLNNIIRPKDTMKKDRPYQHLYNRKWQRMANAFKVANPLCVYCLWIGNTTAAEVVDHIKPHKGDLKLFWDESNWQPLCKHCHDSVKAKEEARGYAIGCDVNGMPLGAHPWNEE